MSESFGGSLVHFEKFQCLFNRHIQHVIDRLSFIAHFECLAVIAPATADFTRHIHIWQEMHLDLYDTISAAGLTASAFDVETETSLLISTCLCIRVAANRSRIMSNTPV